MIKALIYFDDKATRVVWEAGELRVEGPQATMVLHTIRPGGGSAYNPLRGGKYEGFNPADPQHVLDALRQVARYPGVRLVFEELDMPEEQPPVAIPDDKNPHEILAADPRAVYALLDAELPDGER